MTFFDNKTMLITGGTGSFGKKFLEIILDRYKPHKIIIYSRDELKQFEMQQKYSDECIRYFIGDVRDKSRLKMAMKDVDYVVHAAALKQVPAMEYNPFEAVKTNIIGAQNVIETAIECKVEKIIALSTDKAANPINLYGATKLCADKLFTAGNAYVGSHETKFSVVRYGNVIGSRGSVIPYFLKMRQTGEIPITDKRMTRFWITLDQAVDFVISSFEIMHGGEIFVPKIPSMNIMDLAEAIAPNCTYIFKGIRTGEKLHEVMVPEDDARHTIELEDRYLILPDFTWWSSDNYKDARRLPEGFKYSSDTNKEWLTVEDLRKMVADRLKIEKALVKVEF